MMIYRKLMGAGGVGPGLWGFSLSNLVVDGAPWPNVHSMSFGFGSAFSTIRGDELDAGSGQWDLSLNCIFFADSGTKMYLQEMDNKDLYQFTLSTAYDLSSATYASKTVSYLANTATGFSGIFMSSDGTKAWIPDNTTNEIDYYTLSTAYDISTATYDSTSTVVAAQDTSTSSCAVSPDGNTLLISGGAGNVIMEFAFGTAYDMSSLSWTQESAWGSTDDYFIANSDGTRTWSWSGSSDNIYSDTYSTGWDVSTRAISFTAIDISTTCGIPTNAGDDIIGLQWNADGSSFWVVTRFQSRATGDMTAYKVDCSTNYDISTAQTWTEPSQWIDLGLTANQIQASTFGDNGKKFYVLRDLSASGWRVDSFPLSTPYDITTAGSVTTSTFVNTISTTRGLVFNWAGTKLWIGTTTNLYEYNLSTAWDITTISFVTSKSFTRDPIPYGLNQDETEIYCNDFNFGHSRINLNTPGTLAGGSTQTNLDYFAEGVYSPQMSPTGDQFLGFQREGNREESIMNLFSLSTPYDVNTRTLVESFVVPYIFDFYDACHNLNRISNRGHMGVMYIDSIDRWVKIELS